MGREASEDSYLAAYGTLRRWSQYKNAPATAPGLLFYGHGLLRGLLLTQLGYPAVLEQPGLVRVEIFRVLEKSVWPVLDRYEGFNATVGKHSVFIRRAVTLIRPRLRVWVYFLGGEIPRGHLIEML